MNGLRMKRRTFLAAAIGGAAVSQTACQYVPASPVTGSAAPGDFELDEVSLADVGSGLEQGKWTSARLVELYLGRIDAIDRHGPQLNSVLALNPDAAANARQLDEERKNGKLRGPLHGIPILLKDNIETKRRYQHHRRFAGFGRLALAPGRVRSRTAARRRRHHSRQNQSQRMGQLPLHAFHQRLERTRRPDQMSLRAGSQSVRLQLRFGRWRR